MDTVTELVGDAVAQNGSIEAPATDLARWAPVIVGNQKSVLAVLQQEFPLQDKATADHNKRYFYSTISFEEQIERVMRYNKTASSKYVYAVIPYHEYIPEAEMPEELKNVPEHYRTLRFARAEIHR